MRTVVTERETVDLAVVGAGAAGLMTAITCARGAPAARIALLDGARIVGAKILVSGGGRCNVTNTVVTERDYWGGSSRVVRRILKAFSAQRAIAFFDELNVPLHEEEDGKLFPDSNRARRRSRSSVPQRRRQSRQGQPSPVQPRQAFTPLRLGSSRHARCS